MTHPTPELIRLQNDATWEEDWRRWGPYLSERQWGTVWEDYSHNGDAWNHFPHDHAHTRAYRWGRTVCSASVTAGAVSPSHSLCGTEKIRS